MRVAGAVLIADGLLRVAGRRGGRMRPRGVSERIMGAVETAFGLALLERAPVDPASLYRAAAPVYDHLLSPIWRDWLYHDALRAFDAAIVSAHPAGADILDLGCGTGAVLERLLALDLPFRTYTGVDLSPAMLDRARSKLGDVPGTRFEHLDLRVEPPPNGPFDLIVSAWALEHLPEPGAAVEAARARLRPGGRIVLFFELEGRSAWDWPIRKLWRPFGVRLVPEAEASSWPGIVSLHRMRGLGPDVAVATLTAEP